MSIMKIVKNIRKELYDMIVPVMSEDKYSTKIQNKFFEKCSLNSFNHKVWENTKLKRHLKLFNIFWVSYENLCQRKYFYTKQL